MDTLTTIIEELQTKSGFVLYAHGQSGDMGDYRNDNYNIAHRNCKDAQSIEKSIFRYTYSKRHCVHDLTPGTVVHGNLKEESVREFQVQREVRRAIAHEGVLGSVLDFFGGRQIKVQEETHLVQGVVYEQSATLDTYLQEGPNEVAYFIASPLRLGGSSCQYDLSGRRAHPPILYILGTESIIMSAIEYMKRFPTNYNDLIRALIPSALFPESNRLFLDHLEHQGPIVDLDN